jgi:hypothetical protein
MDDEMIGPRERNQRRRPLKNACGRDTGAHLQRTEIKIGDTHFEILRQLG